MGILTAIIGTEWFLLLIFMLGFALTYMALFTVRYDLTIGALCMLFGIPMLFIGFAGLSSFEATKRLVKAEGAYIESMQTIDTEYTERELQEIVAKVGATESAIELETVLSSYNFTEQELRLTQALSVDLE